MTNISRQELWRRLREDGLVEGDMPPIRARHSPWFVRVMLGVAGWIGALFLLAFVGAAFAFVMKSATALLIVGALSCAAAYVMFRAAPERDFATQFALAVSLTGQAMIVMGVFKLFRTNGAPPYFIICAIEAGLAWLMSNFMHRLINTWAALTALWLGLALSGIHGIAPAIAAAACVAIWLSEPRWSESDAIWRPIGYGTALALLLIDAAAAFDYTGWTRLNSTPGWLAAHATEVSAALVGAVVLGAVLRMLSDQQVAAASRAGIAAVIAALLLSTVSFIAPGIASAMLVLLLGFASGNRILSGLGVLALGGFLSHYYYQLQTTLLVKSMALAASGFALLAARAALRKWFGAAEEIANG